jgi:hypothetical protein
VISAAEKYLRVIGCEYHRDAQGRLVVNGALDISGRNLKELPDLTEVVVLGHFICRYNYLTSLKGSPQEVHGTYFCNGNQLTTLEHAPKAVGGNFFANHNPLISLEGAPRKFGRLESDLGNFLDWESVPAHLRITPETKERELKRAILEATVLQQPITARKPLKLNIPPQI